MRRHGWQLPYHPLQLVAIAVFLSLGFAFFVFFVPFVGSHSMKIIITSVYAPLLALVFGSYICCAACDPADPAVLRKRHHRRVGSSASWITSSSVCFTGEKDRRSTERTASPTQSKLEDGCRDEDMLFCSLCEVEILKCSKHCRVCDKCVDSFDHHCRWLNNCIGKRNYRIFIVLMLSGFLMLVVQWAVGVWVIARCFLERHRLEADVSAKLGSIFSLVSFLCVVAVCTVIAAFATLPVGQLCLFHALLIQKGISTYDYILAMREQEQQQYGGSERLQSPYMSPASSVTTSMSGGISVATLHRGPWCTPPRLFVDHEQTAGPVDRIKGIHTDPPLKTNVPEIREKRAPVKISPWALARLNPEDAFRAAAEARKNSSVLQSLPKRRDFGVIAETETDSSDESLRNEVVPGIGNVASKDQAMPWPARGKVPSMSNNAFQVQNPRAPSQAYDIQVQNPRAPSQAYDIQVQNPRVSSQSSGSALVPLQIEARNAFCGLPVSRSTSSSRNSAASLDAQVTNASADGRVFSYDGDLAASSGNSWLGGRGRNNGYETSGGETADDSDGRYNAHSLFYSGRAKKEAIPSRDGPVLSYRDASTIMATTNPLLLNGSSSATNAESSIQQKRKDVSMNQRYYEMVVPDLSKPSFGAPSYYDLSSSETDHHIL